MNNEPVAWMRSDWSRVSLYEGDLCTIPLYTHPAKTLTDEEIFDCATKAEFQYSEEKGIYVKHSNGSWICIGNRLMDFARAILRKAQEK